MITEYTRVKTLVDKEGYPAGTTGVVVHVYDAFPARVVEICDDTDYPIDFVDYEFKELEVID